MTETFTQAIQRMQRKWARDVSDALNQPNALYTHIRTLGASSLDVTPLGSAWDDAMREAAERG
jgi:hypothetical protein